MVSNGVGKYYVDASAVVTDVGLFCRVRLGIGLYKGLYACLFRFFASNRGFKFRHFCHSCEFSLARVQIRGPQ